MHSLMSSILFCKISSIKIFHIPIDSAYFPLDSAYFPNDIDAQYIQATLPIITHGDPKYTI